MALSACLSDLCDVLRQTGFTAREMFGGFDRYVRVLFDSIPLIKPVMCVQCFDKVVRRGKYNNNRVRRLLFVLLTTSVVSW